MKSKILKRLSILRVRQVFHCRGSYAFHFLHDLHPRISVPDVKVEIASLLYVEAVELLKEILKDKLQLSHSEIKKGWEESSFAKKPDLKMAPGSIRKHLKYRNDISHNGFTLRNVKELDLLIDDILSLLVQFGYLLEKPDDNEYVLFFESVKEPIKGKVAFIIEGSYGVQLARDAKPVYYYTFEVHYKDSECTKKISEFWSGLKVDL